MNIKVSLIYDEVLDSINEWYDLIFHNVTHYLLDAEPDVPVPIEYEPVVRGCTQDMAKELEQLFEKPVYGLRLRLKSEPSRAHSSWIAYAAMKFLAGEEESDMMHRTVVGIRQGRRYEHLQQESLFEQYTLLCSYGELARACLQTIVDAENSFDPSRFDADGYERMLPNTAQS